MSHFRVLWVYCYTAPLRQIRFYIKCPKLLAVTTFRFEVIGYLEKHIAVP